MFAIVKADGLN